MKTILKFCVALAFAGIAHAQPTAPVKTGRVEGTITAMSATTVTLAEANGATETIDLLPNWSVTVARIVPVDQIQPGSYVGTANRTNPDGTGVSTEIRVWPPGTGAGNVNRVMDASTQTVMTNGTVATVVKSEGGRVLTVDYGSGSRQITVPPEIPVVLNSPGDRGMIKTGVKVKISTYENPADHQFRQNITVDDKEVGPAK